MNLLFLLAILRFYDAAPRFDDTPVIRRSPPVRQFFGSTSQIPGPTVLQSYNAVSRPYGSSVLRRSSPAFGFFGPTTQSRGPAFLRSCGALPRSYDFSAAAAQQISGPYDLATLLRFLRRSSLPVPAFLRRSVFWRRQSTDPAILAGFKRASGSQRATRVAS